MTAVWEPAQPGSLAALFGEMRPCFAGTLSDWPDGLAILFDKLRGLTFGIGVPANQHFYFAQAEIAALDGLMTRLRNPVRCLEKSAFFADPWAVASLRRDEVRNASVLRWFLDPVGDHGCGDALLTYLLRRIKSCQDHRFPARPFPEKPSARCTVAVEECPDGDLACRVDIQIDDDEFYVIVEVKIDATEQPRQLERYCNVAAARAGSCPWAVVFLTANGRAPVTAGIHTGKVVLIRWKDLAAALRSATRVSQPVPRFLATSFATHLTSL